MNVINDWIFTIKEKESLVEQYSWDIGRSIDGSLVSDQFVRDDYARSVYNRAELRPQFGPLPYVYKRACACSNTRFNRRVISARRHVEYSIVAGAWFA